MREAEGFTVDGMKTACQQKYFPSCKPIGAPWKLWKPRHRLSKPKPSKSIRLTLRLIGLRHGELADKPRLSCAIMQLDFIVIITIYILPQILSEQT
jgi:hypothetical protein